MGNRCFFGIAYGGSFGFVGRDRFRQGICDRRFFFSRALGPGRALVVAIILMAITFPIPATRTVIAAPATAAAIRAFTTIRSLGSFVTRVVRIPHQMGGRSGPNR